MSQFPDERHLSSWAAISPGNNESAGKTKSSRTQAEAITILKPRCWKRYRVASRTKDTFLSARYYNIARRRGSKRAAVAIGHQIHKDVYYILSTGKPYKELGAEAARNRKSDARKCSIIQELEGMGYSVQKIKASA